MQVLATTSPFTYSRANAISSDGRVIAGWNDNDFGRSGVIWRNRVPWTCRTTSAAGSARPLRSAATATSWPAASTSTRWATTAAWRWSEKGGVRVIPNMEYAFAISDDGRTAVGSSSFFEGRIARIWRHGVGTVGLAQYLADNAVTGVPEGFLLVGGFSALSANGKRMAGWGYDSTFAVQSFVIDVVEERILADGFEPRFPPPPPPDEE